MELPKTGDLLLGKYLLEERIGEGGMGVVFAARHELLGQRVAVKLIRPEYAARVESVGRFINEARAAASIDNDHVARVLDVGRLDGGLPYMVLEYLDGADLAHTLRAQGPLPVADVADYLLQSIEAVAHAHAAGIVHRDLKPSNMFLARRADGTSRVKVLDFGISKMTGTGDEPMASVTRTDAMLGSPAYMSPEQLRDAKRVDARSDIWALGVVAYELLTGRRPFDADNVVALFAAIQESEPVSARAYRPDVSPTLDAIIMRCLRRRPEDRYASVTELAYALAPFGSGVASGAYEASNRILSRSASSSSKKLPSGSSGKSLGNHEGIPFADTFDSAPGTERMEPRVSSTLHEARWQTSDPMPTAPRPTAARGSRAWLALAVALGVVAMLAIAAWVLIPRVATRATPASPTSPPSVASAPTPAGDTAAPVSAPPSPPDAPSSAASPEPAPTVKPAGSIKLRAPALPSAKPPATAASGSRPSCNPSYDFDKDGNKIWKRECL